MNQIHRGEPAAAELAVDARILLDVHLDPDHSGRMLRELRQALAESPRRIPSHLFYDDRGSELFERICELPEYYQTRTEAWLLSRHSNRIVALSGAEELVEIGSGAATKTRILLDAMRRAGQLQLYVPLDVAEGTVRRSSRELAAEYPRLQVHGVVGDFMHHLGEIPDGGGRLFLFLGGTIGNLRPADARAFLRELSAGMSSGDHFLLGTDLIKDRARLEAAYDDSQGVTAEFNLNVLEVVNRLAGGDFDPRRFRHRAFYNDDEEWIEMRLVSQSAQTVHLTALDLTLELAAGEEILTEISAKYDRGKAESLLTDSGFELIEWYTDPEQLFGLSLARKP